jgi:hypothetical protein
VLDGEVREDARAVEVGPRLVQVHGGGGGCRGLVRLRAVGLALAEAVVDSERGGWPLADEVLDAARDVVVLGDKN